MPNKQFVIEEAVQGSLLPVGDSDDSKKIDLDMVNTWNMSMSEDTLSARANGKAKIKISANKEVSFEVGVEVLTENTMMFLMGATKDEEGKLHIGSTPNTQYVYTGLAKLKYADNTSAIKKIKATCKPILSDAFGTSSTDLQDYTIKFECLVDENGDYVTVEDNE